MILWKQSSYYAFVTWADLRQGSASDPVQAASTNLQDLVKV